MTKSLNWKAVISAGVIAGIVFMMLEMILIMIWKGQSPWGPPRMMAAMVMGQGVLPPPATFDIGITMAAMIVHFMLSVVLAVIFGLVISRLTLSFAASIVVGTIFGLSVYLVDFYIFTAWFPWFEMSRGAITLFSHAMFGLALGWGYRVIAGRAEPAMTAG
jgi:hypothetical protein